MMNVELTSDSWHISYQPTLSFKSDEKIVVCQGQKTELSLPTSRTGATGIVNEKTELSTDSTGATGIINV